LERSLQISRCLYPDFQIAGAGVAHLTYVAGKPFFQRY
jgi:hypothetical protein